MHVPLFHPEKLLTCSVLLLSAVALAKAEPPAGPVIEGITPPTGAVVTLLKDGFQFTEGPALHPDGSVYFTDLPTETIQVWPVQGEVRVYREQSGRANGLAFDSMGRLIACEMNHGRLSVTDEAGNVQPLATMFQGKPFNQTNDLVIDAKGGVYFSDPYYGPEQSLPQDRMAVYYVKPGSDMVERVVEKGPQKPNGVILAPDGKTLYVIDSEKPTVWCYKVEDSGLLTPAGDGTGKFTDLKLPEGKTDGGGDGGAVDSAGNLYIATELGIQVLSPAGQVLGVIPVPQQPANCAFYGPERRKLFITARTGIYSVDLLIPGASLPAIPPPASTETATGG
jgi:gluconolactonase